MAKKDLTPEQLENQQQHAKQHVQAALEYTTIGNHQDAANRLKLVLEDFPEGLATEAEAVDLAEARDHLEWLATWQARRTLQRRVAITEALLADLRQALVDLG